jgi:RNA polymerase sigma-70 factor (ECF subfamily)
VGTPDKRGRTVDEAEAARNFAALYDAHHGRVFAYVVSRIGHAAADEVVSDTFLIAWRRWADVPDPALPWLLGVARNVIREQVRADDRRDTLVTDLRAWASTSEMTGGDPADEVTERAAVLRALSKLTPDDRELLTLVAWHGLTPQDVVRVLGCSAATYFVRLHRARRRLGRALDDEPEGEAFVPRLVSTDFAEDSAR